MIDGFGRRIDYLRVSVTDHCNFRCIYCMPEEGVPYCSKEETLSKSELMKVLGAAVTAGITRFRLTGGEPLIVNGLAEIIRFLRKCESVEDISLTTNGFLLGSLAEELKDAGLNRVNISLDTLLAERFKTIARRGSIEMVWQGIAKALEVGLGPVKLNCVAMKGVNDDEVVEFARLTEGKELHVRFIELMPIKWNRDEMPFEDPLLKDNGGLIKLHQRQGGMLNDLQMRKLFVSAQEIKSSIESQLGELCKAKVTTAGPARNYRIKGWKGTIGFISQISADLCANCNRLRLTSDGFLRPCLMSDGEVDIKPLLRTGASQKELIQLFYDVVAKKPERHYLAEGQKVVGRTMSQIGG